MPRLWKPLAYVAATIYFMVDALFLVLLQPISQWFAANFQIPMIRAWIRSLPPYPCLFLFSVPVIILEPVKMIAAYMAATGQVIGAAATFVVGELLKVVLVERLFQLTKTKLMKIPAFAWAYGHYMRAKAWVMETPAWKLVRSLGKSLRDHYREWRHSAPRRLNSRSVEVRTSIGRTAPPQSEAKSDGQFPWANRSAKAAVRITLIGTATFAGVAALTSVLLAKAPGIRGAAGDRVLFAQGTIACSDIHAYTGKLKQHDHFCKDWVDEGERGTILQTNDRYRAYCIKVIGYDGPNGCHWFTDGFTVMKE